MLYVSGLTRHLGSEYFKPGTCPSHGVQLEPTYRRHAVLHWDWDFT